MITGVLAWTPLALGWVACLAYVVHVGLGLGGPDVGVALHLATIAGAVLGSAAVARRRAGAPWTLLFVAIAGYGASAAYYRLAPEASGRFPSVADLGFFAFYPLVAAALAGFVRRQVGRFSGTLLLDSLIGALVMAALGAAAVHPLLDGATGGIVTGQFVFLLSNLGFFGFLLTTYALSGWRDGWTTLFLGTGAAALAVADGTYAVDVAHGILDPGPVANLAWAAGILLMGVAPYLKLHRVASGSSSWAQIGIPAASAAACLPIVYFASVASLSNALGAVVLALVIVRLTLSLRQNTRLLASVHRAAITDTLTGLANREQLFERLASALVRRKRHGGELAVMFLDLDEFKAINDVHGHELGDRVLISVAERLRDALRGGGTAAREPDAHPGPRTHDTVGRLGGDEFVVLMEHVRDPLHAITVADRILAEIRAPLVIDDHTLFLDASIGITLADDGDDRGPAELLRDGDTAMYEAKRAGKHRYQVFETDMHDQLVARTELIHDLRTAVTSGQLRVLYQPQVDLASGAMVGVEALVRWQHPDHGLLTPDRFIPLAESAGIIADIDDWVLRAACSQAKAWDDGGLPPLDIAVNVSSRRLTTGDLAATVAAALRETGIAARRLEVEITETAAVEHNTAAVDVLTRVRKLGVSVAIDDFGMGHSALNRLQAFPIDRLKLDRSFVAPLAQGAERGSLVEAMIAMGQGLGLHVIAEGVETYEQVHALRALGCPTAQGYLFSKPVPGATIERLASAREPLAPLGVEAAELGLAHVEHSPASRERLVRSLLAELQRITGLETTYLTRVDWPNALQHITHARNAGAIDIPEGLSIDWADTVCRRALEQGVKYTDDVPGTFPDSEAARERGLQTYLSVPITRADGSIEGTLCGASSQALRLGDDAIQLMEHVAEIIAQADAALAAA
jgi:predicted signal transduction protein with EAL and GGDEF domain